MSAMLYRLRLWLMSGWGFVALGVVLTITAFLLGVVYFSIRAITTSLEHIDIVPTYATALLLCCVGILTMFLYKRRDTIIAVPTMVLTLVCVLLSLTSFILLVVKVIRVMTNFRWCRYDDVTSQCTCFSTYGGNGLSETVYKNTRNCSAIQTKLLRLAYTQTALFMTSLLLCVLSCTLTAYVIHTDKHADNLLQDEEELVEQDLTDLTASASNTQVSLRTSSRHRSSSHHSDALTDPLIGQYSQILSRSITLPDFRFYNNNNGANMADIRCTAGSGVQTGSAGTSMDSVGDQRSEDLPRLGGISMGGNRSNSEIMDNSENARLERQSSNDRSSSVIDRSLSNNLTNVPGLGSSSSQSNPDTINTNPIFRDGYFSSRRRSTADPSVMAANGSADFANSHPPGRRNHRTDSDGGQWTLRPILLPFDTLPPNPTSLSRTFTDIQIGHRDRRRSRREGRRSRSRIRPWLSQRHPYVAFVPVPYSMYQPSALYGLGVSPFPMEPPPPYSAEPRGHNITPNSPAPPYTSRPTSLHGTPTRGQISDLQLQPAVLQSQPAELELRPGDPIQGQTGANQNSGSIDIVFQTRI